MKSTAFFFLSQKNATFIFWHTNKLPELLWRVLLGPFARTVVQGWLKTICCSVSSRSSLWLSKLCWNSDFKPIPSSWPSSPRRTCTSCFCKARPQTHIPSSSCTIPAQYPHLAFFGILAYQNSTKSSFPFVQSTSCCYEPWPQSLNLKFVSSPPIKQPSEELTLYPYSSAAVFDTRTQIPKPSPGSPPTAAHTL